MEWAVPLCPGLQHACKAKQAGRDHLHMLKIANCIMPALGQWRLK